MDIINKLLALEVELKEEDNELSQKAIIKINELVSILEEINNS